MHMARLWDTSRDKVAGGGGYTLEALSSELCGKKRFAKTSMRELFGVSRVLKSGTEGKIKDLPPIRELQLSPQHRQKWIEYSALDAIATWMVHSELTVRLKMMPWKVMTMIESVLTFTRFA